MSYLYSLRIPCVLVAVAILFTACTDSSEPTGAARDVAPAMDTLVTAEWLSRHIDDPDLVVLDATVHVEMTEDGQFHSSTGRNSYEAGHIPGAAFADLMVDLSDANSPHEFAVPTPEQFAKAMGALGVGDNTRVVVYDASGSVWAARVWWMLRWVGFDRAALLDGGLNAWIDAGHFLSTDPATQSLRKLSINLRPELIADRDEVRAAIGDKTVNIIDSLPEAHFKGEMVLYDRPGHIPGALNIPSFSALDETGHYRSLDELQGVFNADRDNRAITYCGGGIAASSNAFVMTRLGFKDVAVYTASLQEWAADPDNPLEVAAPTENTTKE